MSDEFWRGYNTRQKVLRRARDLARSGQHANHETVIAQLEPMDEDARRSLQAFRLQLDRLCALARPQEADLKRLKDFRRAG
jgi:hypothetical protein